MSKFILVVDFACTETSRKTNDIVTVNIDSEMLEEETNECNTNLEVFVMFSY